MLIIPDNKIDVLSDGEKRKPDCEECYHWFFGCLNGRDKWQDKANTPNLRFLDPNTKGGHDRMRCDAFDWRPESIRGSLIA